MSVKQKIVDVLKRADIKIGGKRPQDIIVHDDRLYDRVMKKGSIGLGEGYMDGWWDANNLDEFFNKILRAKLSGEFISLAGIALVGKAVLFNMANKARSKKVAEEHYDLGNGFYQDMLDPEYMQYTCAYFEKAKNLNQAQKDKLDLICRKLQLKRGETVLELGCGFGGFAKYAAKHYGVKVTGYNISKEQIAYARKETKGLGCTFKLRDYREAKGQFDKVVSIGLCEHVGHKNYAEFMQVAERCLKPGGLFLLHTIGANTSRIGTDPWINKYIFPHGMIPSIAQLSKAFQGVFVMEDWHNFGPDYDKTLMAWFANFDKNWKKHKDEYGDRFYRMWSYYLKSCAGAFRARNLQLWQVVFTRQPEVQRYSSVR